MATPPADPEPFDFRSYLDTKEPRETTRSERAAKSVGFLVALIGALLVTVGILLLVIPPLGWIVIAAGIGIFKSGGSLWEWHRHHKWGSILGGVAIIAGFLLVVFFMFQTTWNTARADNHYFLGNSYSQKRDFDNAIIEYTEAIALKPKHADALEKRGLAYIYKEEYAKAIADYDEAIRLKPTLADAFLGRGITNHILKNYDEALADYTESIRLQARNPVAFHNRALTHYTRGQSDEAIADFTKAIRISVEPSFLPFDTRKRDDNSSTDSKLVIGFKFDTVDALVGRGLAYSKKQNYDKAIEDFNEATVRDPNHAVAFLHKGWAYKNKGRYDEAILNYSTAIRLNPSKNASAFAERGIAYHSKEKYNQAMADYNEAIRLDPGQFAYLKQTVDSIKDYLKKTGFNEVVLPDPIEPIKLPR